MRRVRPALLLRRQRINGEQHRHGSIITGGDNAAAANADHLADGERAGYEFGTDSTGLISALAEPESGLSEKRASSRMPILRGGARRKPRLRAPVCG